ncbi:MAG TPA: PLDc N-terminal domain-containing protein [Streptosporangiaceae bacterium]|nr:PLDc N-terminal domain-containing protein [Streptosporangiaceae bacterium]
MLALGALFAMVAIGVWLYCLMDIVLTSRTACRHLPKPVWLAIVAVTFLAGSVAWLLLGRPVTAMPRWSPRRRNPFRSPSHRGSRSRRSTPSHRGSRSRRSSPWHRASADERTALARSRHPAGRARAIGPDDDPEFLRALDHMIRGGYDTGNDL